MNPARVHVSRACVRARKSDFPRSAKHERDVANSTWRRTDSDVNRVLAVHPRRDARAQKREKWPCHEGEQPVVSYGRRRVLRADARLCRCAHTTAPAAGAVIRSNNDTMAVIHPRDCARDRRAFYAASEPRAFELSFLRQSYIRTAPHYPPQPIGCNKISFVSPSLSNRALSYRRRARIEYIFFAAHIAPSISESYESKILNSPCEQPELVSGTTAIGDSSAIYFISYNRASFITGSIMPRY